MKVLFSHAYYYQLDPKQWKGKTPYPPLGTITAASFLRENGYEVGLFDTGLLDGPDTVIPILHDHKPEYLVLYDDGFNYLTKMCLTNMREAAYRMIGYAKDRGCKVVLSSSDSTDHYQKYLEKGADFVLLGEGEETLLELINELELGEDGSDVKGMCFMAKDEVVNTGRRPVIRDLDQIPIAAWDLVDIESYRRIWEEGGREFTLNIATTRGCPYKCNWCAKPIYGNRYNSRSPKQVVEEIEMLGKEFGVSKFWMCDDIFGLKPNWVQEFRDLLKEKGLKIRYKIQSRADLLLQDDTIEALAQSGLEEVWLGAESGSQRILDAMDKGTTLEQIKTSTEQLQKFGVRVAYFLQFGYLGETKEEIEATIQMVADNKPDDIGVSVSYPLPGTKFYDIVQDQLGQKANWTDSDELALMFKNTFNQDYYKALHRFIHKFFRRNQAQEYLKKHSLFSISGVKAFLKKIYYTPLISYYRNKMKRLENVA